MPFCTECGAFCYLTGKTSTQIHLLFKQSTVKSKDVKLYKTDFPVGYLATHILFTILHQVARPLLRLGVASYKKMTKLTQAQVAMRETLILILINLKCYFSHPEKSILNLISLP